MAVTTEKDLTPNSKNLFLRAMTAIETRNFPYAISLLQAILKESPEFLDGRKWLRRAELAATKGSKSFLKGFSGSSITVMKAQGGIKKDPLAVITAAEEILEKEPHSAAANGLLRDAAMAAKMPELAGFALETMRDANPKDTKVLHELARHYSATDQAEKAIEIYNQITGLNPADIEAIKGGKDAAARASMRTGGWDQIGKDGTSYRDVLKNREEAVSLEQQNRLIKSEDVIDQQLTEQFALYTENPQNLDVVRRIASLHEQKDDLEGALQYYRWAVELTKGSDPGLQRKVHDLGMKALELRIEGHDQWLQQYASEANGAGHDEETQATIAQVRAELAEFRREKAELLIDSARKRVERNPTDLTFRYELGEQLIAAENYTDAISELQKSLQSPNLGVKSMNLLGRCFEAKNILPLAIKQYENARAKLPNMDHLKKEVVYRLGLLYERTGEKEKYLASMTEIYEVDSGYLDVAARVERGYME
jgi:tetratricopeptide (TPR) repeat protein